MDDSALASLVATVALKGWRFWTDGNVVHMQLAVPPADNRNPGQTLETFGDSFVVQPDWTRERVVDRLFVQLQFLLDHELREQFTVDGVRPFEAHEPSVTGFQREWFVEHASALKGY